jgi:hypothetical protein
VAERVVTAAIGVGVIIGLLAGHAWGRAAGWLAGLAAAAKVLRRESARREQAGDRRAAFAMNLAAFIVEQERTAALKSAAQ